MPSSHLILCRPLLFLPPIPPSIRVFSNESTLHMRGPKYWSFSFNISPSNEHPGLISFRMDWLDLLAVQGTLKSLLQHYSSKACINSYKCNGFSGWRISLQCRRHGFSPWIGKNPWRRKWQSTPIFWKLPQTKEPGRLQSMDLQRVRHDWAHKLITYNVNAM